MGICRQLLSALVIPKDEFRAAQAEERVIPSSLTPFSAGAREPETYDHTDVGFFTGRTLRYVKAGGMSVADDDAETAEYRAMSEFYKPQEQIDREKREAADELTRIRELEKELRRAQRIFTARHGED